MENEDQDAVDDNSHQRIAVWASIVILVLGASAALGIRWLKTVPEESTSPVIAETPLAKIRKSLQPKIVPAKAAFVEVAAASGVEWTQENGATGQMYFPEAMGTGVAWIDWDNDDDPDLVFVNATGWSDDEPRRVGYMSAFENNGRGEFRDVTKSLGLDVSLYGTGLAVGDYDGDGFTDLFVTALGKNRLFRNIGGDRFEERTEEAGVSGAVSDYSMCAAFFDADSDGDLDLLVGNYGLWNKSIHAEVVETVPGIGLVYNEPNALEGQFTRLYLQKDGVFNEVSEAWGLHVRDESTQKPVGKNLGFGFGYFNNDRVLDVVVANDRVRNLFLLSRESGGFTERAREDGLAYDRRGESSAAMGIDVDRDLVNEEFRVVVGNFAAEMTSLYVNAAGGASFVDETVAEGIGPRTNNRVTFGALFVDYDNDGYRDIFEVNGALQKIPRRLFDVGTPYEQPGDIFWNCGGRCKTTFVYLGPTLSGDFSTPIVGRGLAAADMDGDGDLDLVATGVRGPAYIFRNETQTENRWLRVKLVGKAPNPDAIGAEIVLSTGSRQQYRLVQPSRSYLSANELIQTFGLGQWGDAVVVKIVWPDGSTQEHVIESLNQLVTFHEPGTSLID